MTMGNGVEAAVEENRAQPSLKTVENNEVLDRGQKVVQINKQYIPSDTLQLETDRDSSNESNFRTLGGNVQFVHGPSLPRSNAAIDLLVTIFCFASVHLAYWGNLDFTSHRSVVLLSSLVVMIVSLSAGGIYSRNRTRSLNGELSNLILCWVCAFAVIGMVAFLTKTAGEVSRFWTTASLGLTLVSLAAVRLLGSARFIAGNRSLSRNVVLCGHAPDVKTVMHSMYRLPSLRVKVAKIFEIAPQLPTSGSTKSVNSSAKEMIKYVENQRQSGEPIEQVWIAVSANQSQIVEELSESLINSPVDVCIVPDLYTEKLLEGEITKFGDTRIVNISEISLSRAADRFKRVFDVTIASTALFFLSIPMLIIASLVKLESPGPALFRQKRYGIDGKEIEILKFRSMCVHSDSAVRQATKNDTRVTRIGKFLRSSSLDELPQLLNVLGGSMSLIGPRPHAVAHNEMWRTQIEGYMLRHKVRPGITGWAQVNGWRGETDTAHKMQQRVKYDLEYIRNWSPLLDIKIMLYTVVKGFYNENAY